MINKKIFIYRLSLSIPGIFFSAQRRFNNKINISKFWFPLKSFFNFVISAITFGASPFLLGPILVFILCFNILFTLLIISKTEYPSPYPQL